MKNSILNYNSLSSKQFTSQYYHSKYFNQIKDIIELKDSSYIETKELMDNQTIENISYILYGTPDYWDILVLINIRDPLFGMTYNFDIIDTASTNVVTKFMETYSGTGASSVFDKLKKIVLNNYDKLNEEKRTIRVIRPERINDFMKILNSIDFKRMEYVKSNEV